MKYPLARYCSCSAPHATSSYSQRRDNPPQHTRTVHSSNSSSMSQQETRQDMAATKRAPEQKPMLGNTAKTLFPIDAKLMQYHYTLEKITRFHQEVATINESVRVNADIVYDPQSIMLLAGAIFNLNDNFYRRAELLQNCLKFNTAQKIDVPLVLAPISFDSLENISRTHPVGPYGMPLDKLVTLPNKKKIQETLVLLDFLLKSVYDVILQRYNIALSQFNKHHGTSETRESLTTQLQDLNFSELELIPRLHFKEIPEINLKHQESIMNFYLTTQFQFMELKCISFQNIVDELKVNVHGFISHLTKSMKQPQMASHASSLYSMYLTLVRIADLYIEIRKTGKTVYFQNINYFSPYLRQRKTLHVTMTKMIIHFTQSKQNGMILTLISKYAKRSEIKNMSLDYNIFVAEFRKVSLEMICLLDTMINLLKSLHDEWTDICTNGKDKEFSKEYLREKLRERVSNDRAKRLSVLIENQKEMKIQMEHQKTGAVSPKDMNDIHSLTQQKLKQSQPPSSLSSGGKSVRRVSSMDSIDEHKAPIIPRAATQQRNISPNTMKLRRASVIGTVSSVASQPASAQTSRVSSLTGSAHSPFYRPNSAGSISASTSRNNSLTRTDALRQQVIKSKPKSSDSSSSPVLSADEFSEPPRIGDSAMQKITPNNSLPGGSNTGSPRPLSTASPGGISRSPSLARRRVNASASSSANNSRAPSRTGSLTQSPSTIKNREMLQRRSSVNLSHSPSYNQLRAASGSPSSHTAAAAAGASASVSASTAGVRRRQSVIGMGSITRDSEQDKESSTRAAALATRNNTPHHLTAQQRLQQHILKSAQEGSVYGKPLEKRRVTASPYKSSSPSPDTINSATTPTTTTTTTATNGNASSNSSVRVSRSSSINSSDSELNSVRHDPSQTKTIDETIDESLASELESLKITPQLRIDPSSPIRAARVNVDGDLKKKTGGDIDSETDSLSEFPSSPLNSLKLASLEAQNALKLQRLNRSRSNSNQQNGSSIQTTPTSAAVLAAKRMSVSVSAPVSLSPMRLGSPQIAGSPSQSPSASRTRSRSNSALQMNHVSSPSRAGVSSSAQTVQSRSRSRSASISRRNSVIGNTMVVSEADVTRIIEEGNEDGEKRVRFTGVTEYTEDEDAPTPQRLQKQIRQKWSAYKPVFRKLNQQEGLVFKQNHFEGHEQIDMDYAQQPQLQQPQMPLPRTTLRETATAVPEKMGLSVGSLGGSNRFSRLFRKR